MFQVVIDFWFKELEPSSWFVKDEGFDALLRERFLSCYQQAIKGELYQWRTCPQGRLAEIIVLDQFSRNMFRDRPEAFSSDTIALVLAQTAVAAGCDQPLSPQERSFLYMPYMHSESAKVHEIAVQLFSQPGLERNLEFELRHKTIIDRFGRYPHRNKILGRVSTPEELEFLAQPGSSF